MSWDVPQDMRDYRSPDDPVLREGHLELLQGSNTLPCMITLTRRSFVYAVNGIDECTVSWNYIVGCHCLRGRQGNGCSAYFCLYTYPPVRQKRVGEVRRQYLITFAVDIHKTYQENMDLAKTWQTNILECIYLSLIHI